MADAMEVFAANLKQQIGEMAVRYEEQMAALKTNAGIQIEALQEEVKQLKEKYEPVQEEGEAGTPATASTEGNTTA